MSSTFNAHSFLNSENEPSFTYLNQVTNSNNYSAACLKTNHGPRFNKRTNGRMDLNLSGGSFPNQTLCQYSEGRQAGRIVRAAGRHITVCAVSVRLTLNCWVVCVILVFSDYMKITFCVKKKNYSFIFP